MNPIEYDIELDGILIIKSSYAKDNIKNYTAMCTYMNYKKYITMIEMEKLRK